LSLLLHHAGGHSAALLRLLRLHLLLHLLRNLVDVGLKGLLCSTHDGLELFGLGQIVLVEGDNDIRIFNGNLRVVGVESLELGHLLDKRHLRLRDLAHLVRDNGASHDLNLLHLDSLDVRECGIFFEGLVSWTSHSEALLKLNTLGEVLNFLNSIGSSFCLIARLSI